MAQTANYGGFGYADGGVKYIQCCRCQTTHFEDEPLFETHLYYQSKHGIFEMSRADFEKMRLTQVERDTLAAELREIDERRFYVLKDGETLSVREWHDSKVLFKLSRRLPSGSTVFGAHEVPKWKIETSKAATDQFRVLIEYLIRIADAEERKLRR